MTEKRVLLHVEDDIYLLDELSDYVGRDAFHVLKARSYAQALQVIERVSRIDCAVADMMLPEELNATPEMHAHEFGARVARALKLKFPGAYVVATSKRHELSHANKDFIDEFIVKKEDTRYLRSISHQVRQHFGLKRAFPLNCLIVHDDGAAGDARSIARDLVAWIKLNTSFGDPVVLADEPGTSLSLIERFEALGVDCEVVFVVIPMHAMLGVREGDDEGRSREAVVFEAGYFLARLGHDKKRLIVLHKDEVELPSRLPGVLYVDVGKGIIEAHSQLLGAARDLGC